MTILGRKRITLSSPCISSKAIPTASLEIQGEVSLLCRDCKWHVNLLRRRGETDRQYGTKENER